MNHLAHITDTLKTAVDTVDSQQLISLAQIIGERRVFVTGLGRSGLVGRAFAMRLMQLGLTSFVIGETITPAIQTDDILVVISGSGETSSLIAIAEKAKQLSAVIIAVTTTDNNTLSRLSDHVLLIQANAKFGDNDSGQPMGALFEQSALIVLDALVLHLMKQLNITEEIMKETHANLE